MNNHNKDMKRLPKYKKGGNSKTDFISEKTAYLISKEGMKASEAYAVANAMYMQQNKEYQYGGFQLNTPNINNLLQSQTVSPQQDFSVQNQNYLQNAFTPAQPTVQQPQIQSALAGINKIETNNVPQIQKLNNEIKANNFYGSTAQKPNENYKQQFFDVYGGIDIPTAAYTLGEGIQTGNTWETIGSGLKLATGLARNAFAGAGNAKRRDYILKDAQEKYRDSLTPDAQGFQKGGYYQQGGEMIPPPQEQSQQIDPNQIAQALQQGADPNEVLQMLVQAGMPQEEATQLIQQIMQQLQSQGQQSPQEQGQSQSTEEAVTMQNGGKYKALTGEYTIEKDRVKEEEIVAELEHGEFLKTPTQEITQIDGNTHEKGGAKLTEDQIPEGSEIISDHLKLTKEQVKVFSDNYDLKLSTKDTYADVLHKWNKKVGLEKNTKEQEELIKAIEKQTKLLQEKPEAEVTITLNIDLLQKELAELEQEKAPLEEERKAVFNEVFKAQESQKPKEKKEDDKMQNGGMFNGDMVISYAKKHGISPDRAMELVNMYKNGGYKTYQDAGTFFTPSRWAKQKYENQPYIEGLTTASGELSNYQGINERANVQNKNLPYLSKRVGLVTENNTPNLGSISKFQPGYDEYVDTTNIEIDNNPYLSDKQKEEYKKIATAQKLSLSNKQGKYDAVYGEETSTRQPFKLPYLTTEDRKKYPNLAYIGDAFDEKGDIKPEFENLDVKTKDLLKSTYKRQGAKAFDIQLGEVGQPVVTTDANNTDTTTEETQKTPFDRGNSTKTRMGIMALPDQYAPLPDALQGNLKLEYRPNLVDKQNVTVEPIIAEIRRQEQSAMQAIQNLPDAQRAAATAQLQANTQDQINKAMNQVQAQNLQSDIQVGNLNTQTLNQAQDINNRYTLDFEGKILKADALTRNDVRNWMNHNQAVNVANSKAINQLNYYNALSEYNQITPNGIVQTKEPEFRYSNLSNAQIEMEAKKIEDERKRREKEASKKKNGGRIKRKL